MTPRRFGLAALAALWLVCPTAARPQSPSPMRVIGVLLPDRPPVEFPAFLDGLRRRGHEEGRTLTIIMRSANGDFERLPALAAELVDAKVEVLVALFTPSTRAAMAATTEVPIVGFFGEPMASGFVASVARPGGNVTGVSNLCGELAGKRLALLKDAVPSARRVGVLLNAGDPVTEPQIFDLERSAPALGVEARLFRLRSPDELPATFDALSKWRAHAVLWLCGQSGAFQKGTIELAAKRRLPTMVLQKQHVEAGGLMSYFPDHFERLRMVATYVDKILNGTKPAALPVEQPTKLELVVNLKTARALGLTIPPAVLARADHVIE